MRRMPSSSIWVPALEVTPARNEKPGPSGHPLRVLSLVTNPDTFRVLAAIDLGASTVDQIRQLTNIPRKRITKAVDKLVESKTVVARRDMFEARIDELRVAFERLRASEEESEVPEEVRRFFKRGRLTAIPVPRGKRMVVLDYLASKFEPGRYYSEKEVNAALREFLDDYVTLRRYLVDAGFLERDARRYWRGGGSFPVD